VPRDQGTPGVSDYRCPWFVSSFEGSKLRARKYIIASGS
jgi:hypothetical protein